MRIRLTARTLVVDLHQRVLLFHIDDGVSVHANRPELIIYWLTPGGGVEPNETFEQAACRELWEETGIQIDTVGPWLWQYERVIQLPHESMLVQERFYLVHVATPQVDLANLLPYEQQTHRAYRWWTLDELAQSSDYFLPTDLPQLLRPILNGDIPTEPLYLST